MFPRDVLIWNTKYRRQLVAFWNRPLELFSSEFPLDSKQHNTNIANLISTCSISITSAPSDNDLRGSMMVLSTSMKSLNHLVNSNSTSNLSIPIPLFTYSFFKYYLLPREGTPSTYFEYLLLVVYIRSRIVMEEIFLNLKIKW